MHLVIVDEIIEERDEKLLEFTGQYMWGLSGTGTWEKDDIDFVARFTQPYLAYLFNYKFNYERAADRYVNYLCYKTNYIKSTTGCLDALPGIFISMHNIFYLPFFILLTVSIIRKSVDVKEDIVEVEWIADTVVQPIGKKVLGSREVAQIMSLCYDNEIATLATNVAQDLERIPSLDNQFAPFDLPSMPGGAGAFIEEALHSLTAEITSLRLGEIHEVVDFDAFERMGKEAAMKKIAELLYNAKANADLRSGELEKERLALAAFVQSVSFKRLRAKEREKTRLVEEMSSVLNEPGKLCPICRECLGEEDELVVTDCLHVFKKECISPLFKNNKHAQQSCPGCRASISSIRAVGFTKFGEDGTAVDISEFAKSEDVQYVIVAVVEAVREILTVQNAKILIFTHDSAMALAIHNVICKAGVYSVQLVKKGETRESIWQYKFGAAQALVFSQDADFSGLNFSVSTHLFIVGMPGETEEEIEYFQEIDQRVVSRVYRLGLKHDLVLKRFRRI